MPKYPDESVWYWYRFYRSVGYSMIGAYQRAKEAINRG